MARTHKVHQLKGAVRCNSRQTLPQRIKWLRAHQNPPMTQAQLAELARISQDMVTIIENSETRTLNMELGTLKKIAHALGCEVYVNLKPRPSKLGTECLPLDHDLPPLPKRKRRSTVQARQRAAKLAGYPWKGYRQRVRRGKPKSTSDKDGSVDQAIVHGAAWDTE